MIPITAATHRSLARLRTGRLVHAEVRDILLVTFPIILLNPGLKERCSALLVVSCLGPGIGLTVGDCLAGASSVMCTLPCCVRRGLTAADDAHESD